LFVLEIQERADGPFCGKIKAMRILYRKIIIILPFVIVVLVAFFYAIGPMAYRQCTTDLQKDTYLGLHGKIGLIFWIMGLISLSAIFFRHIPKIKRRVIRVFAVILSILFLLFVAVVTMIIFIKPYSGIGGGAAHIYMSVSGDRERLREINSLPYALEHFYNVVGYLPRDLNDLVPEYTSEEDIKDPKTGEVYGYKLSDNGSYVIKTILGVHEPFIGCVQKIYLGSASEIRSSLLDSPPDLDGEILGLDCDDPAYCMGGSKSEWLVNYKSSHIEETRRCGDSWSCFFTFKYPRGWQVEKIETSGVTYYYLRSPAQAKLGVGVIDGSAITEEFIISVYHLPDAVPIPGDYESFDEVISKWKSGNSIRAITVDGEGAYVGRANDFGGESNRLNQIILVEFDDKLVSLMTINKEGFDDIDTTIINTFEWGRFR